MATPEQLAALKPFRPGQSGNPGGKPVAARNRIQTAFLNKLAADFDEHGVEAIVACREKDPAKYVQIVAALMPKQVEQTQPLDEMTDEQLLTSLDYLRQRVVDRAGAGAGAQISPQQAH